MFKKFLTAALFFLTAPVLASPIVQQENAHWIHYRSPSTTISTAAVVVDLSDTSNWPHRTSGAAKILGWRMEVDQVAAGTSTVKLGVVTAVNASSGTVSWFYTKNLTLNVSGTTKLDPVFLSPSEINTRVQSNATPLFLGSENTIATSSDAALFQTDVTLPTARGNSVVVAPSIGDIVLEVVGGGTNAALVTLDLLYLTEP